MATILPKKYDNQHIIADPIDEQGKLKNITFLLALISGNVADMEMLFNRPTSEVLASFSPKYSITPAFAASYRANFPEQYIMDDIIAQNAIGLVAVFSAQRNWRPGIKEQMTDLLLKHGARASLLTSNQEIAPTELARILDIRPDIIQENYNGFTALHTAVTDPRPERREKEKLLIDREINVNSSDIARTGTALHVIIANESTEHAVNFIEMTRFNRHIAP